MRRMLIAATLATGCFGEPGPDDHIIASATTPMTTAEPEESSSSDGESSSDGSGAPYGPCAIVDDCADVVGANGAVPMLTECVQGTCVYICGGSYGDADICPLFPDVADCVDEVHKCGVKKFHNPEREGAGADCDCGSRCADASPSSYGMCMTFCLGGVDGEGPCMICPDGMFEGGPNNQWCYWQAK